MKATVITKMNDDSYLRKIADNSDNVIKQKKEKGSAVFSTKLTFQKIEIKKNSSFDKNLSLKKKIDSL